MRQVVDTSLPTTMVGSYPRTASGGRMRHPEWRDGARYALTLALLLALLPLTAGSPRATGAPVAGARADADQATLTVLASTVSVTPAAGEPHSGVSGETLHAGDTVETSVPGRALVTFFDGSEADLDEGTRARIDALGY